MGISRRSTSATAGPHFHLIGWLDRYLDGHARGRRGRQRRRSGSTWTTCPNPTCSSSSCRRTGGQARIGEDDYIAGAPELIAEVASSSVSYDLHDKLNVYRRNGVREYVVWRVHDQAIDWFVLREGRYERLPLGPDGLYPARSSPACGSIRRP